MSIFAPTKMSILKYHDTSTQCNKRLFNAFYHLMGKHKKQTEDVPGRTLHNLSISHLSKVLFI